jgi:AbrB family looped-hinge helix DNA binding protein
VARANKKQAIDDLPTTSAKIRALHQEGHKRAEIARLLNIRYQHVRNVLERDATREAEKARHEKRLGSAARSSEGILPVKVKLGPDGRIVIPAELRQALNLKDGDSLMAEVADGEIHLLTTAAEVRRDQALVRRYVPEGVSLVDELIAERRQDAERENG